MTAGYTFDGGDWGGSWGEQGPEFLDHRLAQCRAEQRMVLGIDTFRKFVELLGPGAEDEVVADPIDHRMRTMPATVVSTTLEGLLDRPDATLVSGDAVDVVARLEKESDVPLASHGSLSVDRALTAARLVDRVQLTVFRVITGETGVDPVFRGAADVDPELLESRTLDGRIQELVHRSALHG
ncbi:RibD domain-containing protein [Geodermatophilus tzadiensis]|uniref:RibD domain-containing protein n=1 Tax=Geodermatophilus tzadiensis TaxID=1137988 RepID=A0A2T0TNY0_9ACTN|nr:dihydrofolate reductase family protein [Geodermatophilus tzadiensis]PRY47432.1 RibD domain-containing protein [Geodermatophilus tzadiensis]